MKTLFGETMEGQTLPVRLVRIFKELDLRFEVFEGEDRDWVEAAAVGHGLGYKRPSHFARLLDRYRDEFYGMGHVFELNELGVRLTPNSARLGLKVGPNSARSGRPSNIYLDAQGVIKAFMLSRAKNAKQFREWASSVLVPVLFSRGKRMSMWTGIPVQERMELIRSQFRKSEMETERRLKAGPYLALARIMSHGQAMLELGKDSGINVAKVNDIIDIARVRMTGQQPYPLLQPLK